MNRISGIKIFISRSPCIFHNLAFEEWLFRLHDLERYEEAVLMWSNNPSVVIGRHQNPWLESDVQFVLDHRINLVRRFSGGGAVYHDLGNLNVSILTSLNRHNRARNLLNISGWLNQHFNVRIETNKRDDLLLQPGDRKISGTAARIAHGRAYHHLTLLVNPDLTTLRRSLQSPFSTSIETNATRSTKAKAVGRLVDESPDLKVRDLIPPLVNGFGDLATTTKVIELCDFEKQVGEDAWTRIQSTVTELKSKEWTFDKSPRFTIRLPDSSKDLRFVDVESGRVVKTDNSLYKLGSNFYQINGFT